MLPDGTGAHCPPSVTTPTPLSPAPSSSALRALRWMMQRLLCVCRVQRTHRSCVARARHRPRTPSPTFPLFIPFSRRRTSLSSCCFAAGGPRVTTGRARLRTMQAPTPPHLPTALRLPRSTPLFIMRSIPPSPRARRQHSSNRGPALGRRDRGCHRSHRAAPPRSLCRSLLFPPLRVTVERVGRSPPLCLRPHLSSAHPAMTVLCSAKPEPYVRHRLFAWPRMPSFWDSRPPPLPVDFPETAFLSPEYPRYYFPSRPLLPLPPPFCTPPPLHCSASSGDQRRGLCAPGIQHCRTTFESGSMALAGAAGRGSPNGSHVL